MVPNKKKKKGSQRAVANLKPDFMALLQKPSLRVEVKVKKVKINKASQSRWAKVKVHVEVKVNLREVIEVRKEVEVNKGKGIEVKALQKIEAVVISEEVERDVIEVEEEGGTEEEIHHREDLEVRSQEGEAVKELRVEPKFI